MTIIIAVFFLLISNRGAWADCDPGERCGPSEVELSGQAMAAFKKGEAELAVILRQAMKITAAHALAAKQEPKVWKATLQRLKLLGAHTAMLPAANFGSRRIGVAAELVVLRQVGTAWIE